MILTTLNAALSSGLAIGGFPIESVSLTAVEVDANGNPAQVYSSDADAKKYRDIAIIVGVVIPVGLIIIFIIFFILYKKGIICAN